MNVTLISLEALVLKATHESLTCPEPAALEAFCTIMNNSPDGPQLAAQALAGRIQNSNPVEVILSLTMLDRCMRKSNSNFHAEIGKFRFLNEMIKLVSPKYFADQTPPAVKTRVLQLLHAWSIEYPKEQKFKVAYDMLKNQGVIKESPPPLPSDDSPEFKIKSRAKNTIFEDEEKAKMLQKLLQSKKTEDLQLANKLIKTMVREEEHRNEVNSRRAQEVSAALDNADLLSDMLDHASDPSEDETQLMRELHSTCERLHVGLQQLAGIDMPEQGLEDIIQAIDVLDRVKAKYNLFEVRKKEQNVFNKNADNVDDDNSLLDFAGVVNDNSIENKSTTTNRLDELSEIFSNTSCSTNIPLPLKPLTLNKDIEESSEHTNTVLGWNSLDTLSEQLIKDSLPESLKTVNSFKKKTTKKVPMNSLEKKSNDNTRDTLDLDFFTGTKEDANEKKSQIDMNLSSSDDSNLDLSNLRLNTNRSQSLPSNNESPLVNIMSTNAPLENIPFNNNNNIKSKAEKKDTLESKSKAAAAAEIKPMTDIDVDLNFVRPSNLDPMTIIKEDEGVTVVLHICQDKPREDVNVVVISTTSNCTSPINDYRIHAIVPKTCKVRLLPASGCSLPPITPFLPPPALTQLMLLARPPSQPLDLKLFVTYTCECDTRSEMGEVTLPLDDVQ